LRAILHREAGDTGADAPLRRLEAEIERLCQIWAGRHLLEVYPAGAYEKGTANQSGVSIDFVVSLSPQTPFRMREIYESLHGALEREGLEPVRRPVALGLRLEGATIDIIPAKRESIANDIHEIYSSRREAAMKTNLTHHVLDTVEAGRREEIRILKLWRDQHGLEFPSFYLELATVAALRKRPLGELSDNVWHALGYFAQLFVARATLDPANANNVVSEELGTAQKMAIARAAAEIRTSGRPWSEIVV
jgi:hypothetical protein